jgi:hypothetical protein
MQLLKRACSFCNSKTIETISYESHPSNSPVSHFAHHLNGIFLIQNLQRLGFTSMAISFSSDITGALAALARKTPFVLANASALNNSLAIPIQVVLQQIRMTKGKNGSSKSAISIDKRKAPARKHVPHRCRPLQLTRRACLFSAFQIA